MVEKGGVYDRMQVIIILVTLFHVIQHESGAERAK